MTDAEIDAAMSTWIEKFMKRNLANSEERLLSAWMDKYPSFGRHGTRELPENLEKPPELAAPNTRTLQETLGACSVVRDRVQIGGAKPAFCGTVGDAGAPLLCTARRAPAFLDSATWCLDFAGPEKAP